MSVPSFSAIVPIKSGVDDPTRFRRSRDIRSHFGRTPRKYQSDEIDITDLISETSDRMGRTAL
jgi:transposase